MRVCDIDGCGREALWTVIRPNVRASRRLGTTRIVCDKCRDELVAVFGWHLLYDHGRVPPVSPSNDGMDGPAYTTRMNLERVVRNIPDTDPMYHRGATEGTV